MDKKYNIVILSSPHPKKIAGIVAYDVKCALERAGNNCLLITNSYMKDKEDNIISLCSYITDKYRRIKGKFEYLLKNNSKIDSKYYFNTSDESKRPSRYKIILNKLNFVPDAFIYLFPQNFLTVRDLYYLNNITNAPIFWYMMDMNPMTGGCHYAWDCVGYKQKCGRCPGLHSNNPNDITNINWNYKKEFIEKTNIIPIAASEWQMKQLTESQLFVNKKKFKILLPVDDKMFTPGNKIKARKKYNLPLNKKILLFGSVNIFEPRKGYLELIKSFNKLKKLKTDIIILSLNEFSALIENDIPFETYFIGKLTHEELITAYQASDLFLNPSIEDSGPSMLNQALMCGLPIVSFEMGVAMDLVMTNETGYRARLFDTDDFASGICTLLNISDYEYNKISETCRMKAISTFGYDIVSNEFNNIFFNN